MARHSADGDGMSFQLVHLVLWTGETCFVFQTGWYGWRTTTQADSLAPGLPIRGRRG